MQSRMERRKPPSKLRLRSVAQGLAVRSTLRGVAYLVHVGGFIFGLVAATTFTRADRLGEDQGP